MFLSGLHRQSKSGDTEETKIQRKKSIKNSAFCMAVYSALFVCRHISLTPANFEYQKFIKIVKIDLF